MASYPPETTQPESIIVASVEQKTTSTGKVRLAVKGASGKWYSVWDQGLFGQIGQGQIIHADVSTESKDGQSFYTIRALHDAPLVRADAPVTLSPETSRDRYIRRQVALKAAVELFAMDNSLGRDNNGVLVLALAARFDGWLIPPVDADDELPF